MAKKDFTCRAEGCGHKQHDVILSCHAPAPACTKCGGETAQDFSEYGDEVVNIGDYKFRLQQFVKEDDTFGDKDRVKGTLMVTVPRNMPGG